MLPVWLLAADLIPMTSLSYVIRAGYFVHEINGTKR